MSRFVRIGCLSILLLTACGEGALNEYEPGPAERTLDAGPPGVCVLSSCPAPAVGVACCMGNGSCGQDPSGFGAFCVPNPGESWNDNVCVVANCPLPTIGNQCCTGYGTCGYDPTETGLVCYQNPVTVRGDAGQPEPTCPVEECPLPEVGFACCTNAGGCGTEYPNLPGLCYPNPEPVEPTCPIEDCPLPEVGFACCTNAGGCGTMYPNLPGLCYPEVEPTDGGMPDAGPIDTSVPDDPSVTGECPSYIGINGLPVWGCCSDYSVCGTFAYGACLLPAGTQIPVGPAPDADAGVTEPFMRCTPPSP